MTTNDAISNPVSATLPVPEVPSLLLFRSTLAIKMAGHAVVGFSMGRRPRSVWLNPRDGMYGIYRLDRPKADAELSAMVALGGYVALNIAESMDEPTSKGFREAALCTDVHHASMYFPTEGKDRPALALRLLPIVQDLLESEWEKLKVVAAYLHEHGMIDGATLGRLVLAGENIEVPGPQYQGGERAIAEEPKSEGPGPVSDPFVIQTLELIRSGQLNLDEGEEILRSKKALKPTARWAFEAVHARGMSVQRALDFV